MLGSITVEPIIAYPRQASPGGRYVMRVDLRHHLPPAAWPYAEEEYALTCVVDAAPLFSAESVGDQAIVLHRFGGSYGPVVFILTATDRELTGSARVTFISRSGMPVKTIELSGIEVSGRHALLETTEPVLLAAAAPAARIPSPAPRSFRWRHIGDLSMTDAELRVAPAPDSFGEESDCDAFFVTGDLTDTGTKRQASAMQRWLRHAAAGLGELPILAVPGNHDCDGAAVAQLARLEKAWGAKHAREAFWSGAKTAAATAMRVAVEAAFAPFCQVQRAWSKGLLARREGLVPGDFCGTLRTRTGLRVGVVGLNSAITSLFTPGFGRVEIDARQLLALCDDDPDRWASGHDVNVLLMHHHREWLTRHAQTELAEIVKSARFDVMLVGSSVQAHRLLPFDKNGAVAAWYQGERYSGRARPNVGYAAGAITFEGQARKGTISPIRVKTPGASSKDAERLPTLDFELISKRRPLDDRARAKKK